MQQGRVVLADERVGFASVRLPQERGAGAVIGWISYRAAVEYRSKCDDFYGLLMATMWKADSYNAARLRMAFPDVFDELQARYDAPGGVLDSDPEPLRRKVLSGELP
jgi:hypothetical protein